MSQGGDDAALIITDVNDQYDTALITDVNDPYDATFLVAAVAPPALIALPQQPAPVLAVVAEDFQQEGLKAKAH